MRNIWFSMFLLLVGCGIYPTSQMPCDQVRSRMNKYYNAGMIGVGIGSVGGVGTIAASQMKDDTFSVVTGFIPIIAAGVALAFFSVSDNYFDEFDKRCGK